MKISHSPCDLINSDTRSVLPLYLLASFLLISGVTHPVFALDPAKANLTIEVKAESVKPKGTKYKVTQYADEKCGKRGKTDRLLEKRNAKGKHTFKPLSIDAESDFVFQVSFEQKQLRQLKSCSSIAKLSPKAGHEYKVVYEVNGEVLGCGLVIYDLTAPEALSQAQESDLNSEDSVDRELNNPEESSAQSSNDNTLVSEQSPVLTQPFDASLPVTYDSPELACLKVGRMGFKNNVPVHTALELKL